MRGPRPSARRGTIRAFKALPVRSFLAFGIRDGGRHGDTPMAIAILAALACAALPAVAPAQVPSNSPVPMPSETVNLTMEQRHIIKEIIIKDMKTPATPAQAAAKVTTKPGEVVPSGVALQPMPVEVAIRRV